MEPILLLFEGWRLPWRYSFTPLRYTPETVPWLDMTPLAIHHHEVKPITDFMVRHRCLPRWITGYG